MWDINFKKHTKELFEFLSIPSVSAQSAHNNDMLACANWLNKKFEQLKFKSEVLKTEGHPVIYAERFADPQSSTTVLIYGHYDVQSPDPLDEWTSSPFEPEIRSGNVYARGSADDKGQLYTWIAAIDHMTRTDLVNRLPNIKFFIEGEEEVGSDNLKKFIYENKSLLESDICLISDSHALSEDQPVLTYGLRGLVYFELKIKTLAKDVHSGTYGGNVYNPVNVLTQLIASIKGSDHKILIPNFYENVRKPKKGETEKLKKFPFTSAEVIKETGAEVTAGEREFSEQLRISSRPSFDTNGIWGGYQGEGPKTIIPAEAGTKFSFRIVPYQTSDEIIGKVEDYIKNFIPDGVHYDLNVISTGEPILYDTSSKYFKIAEKVLTKTFKNKPLHFASGGSIPITAMLKEILGVDCVLLGYGLPDDGLHSPNEKMSLTMFEKGIRTNIEYLKSI